MLEGGRVRPFSERALYESLGLAVGLRRVRFGEDVLDAELPAGTSEQFGAVATAVVGHQAIDGDAQARELGNGRIKRGDRTLLSLVGEDLCGCDARMVIDRDVNKLVTNSSLGVRLVFYSGDESSEWVGL